MEFLQIFDEVQVMAPDYGAVIAIILAVVLLLFSGFASGSEIAFFSLSPADLSELEEERTERDRKILALREDSERTLATILITNNLVNVTIIMLCNYFFAKVIDFGHSHWIEFICLTVLLTFLLLLFGEIMPKVYTGQQPLRFCRTVVTGILFCRYDVFCSHRIGFPCIGNAVAVLAIIGLSVSIGRADDTLAYLHGVLVRQGRP